MPNANTVRNLLAATRERAVQDWNYRLDLRLRDHDPNGTIATAVVRIMPEDTPALHGFRARWRPEPSQIPQIGNALKITVQRHLGEDEFVVVLHQDHDQNELALAGHLDVVRGGFRMIAI